MSAQFLEVLKKVAWNYGSQHQTHDETRNNETHHDEWRRWDDRWDDDHIPLPSIPHSTPNSTLKASSFSCHLHTSISRHYSLNIKIMLSNITRRIATTTLKGNTAISFRPFGALTQKSWPIQADNNGRLKSNVVEKQQGVQMDTTDMFLEDLFSRQIPLPHTSLSRHPFEVDLPTNSQFSLEDIDDFNDTDGHLQPMLAMNRNARKPKRANKGARPCSRASRRRKKEKFGKRKR